MGMKKLITSWWSNKSNMKFVLPPALLIICNLFIFMPATIYSGNISEFSIGLSDMLKYYVVPGLLLLLVLLSIGMVISKKYVSLYVAATFALGILMWAQGNLLVWNYGLLDGQAIDWVHISWRGWIDSTLWIALLLLAGLFRKRVSKRATLACTIVIALQFVTLTYATVQKPEIWQKKVLSVAAPPKQVFEFSTKQNVIQIILDMFQADIFEEIIAEDPDYYRSKLEGFTFFKDTIGSFPSTFLSIPSIVSGKKYKNSMPIPDFITNIFQGKTIINTMFDRGYEVDIVTGTSGLYDRGRYSNYYHIPIPYGKTEHQHGLTNAASLFDLVLFRVSPHFLKRAIYNNQAWMIRRLSGQKKYAHLFYFAHKAFFDDLIHNISANRTEHVYKVFHLFTSHTPVVVDKEGNYAGEALPATRENVKTQCKFVLDDLLSFLGELKTMGIYHSSLVIVHADHGGRTNIKMHNNGLRLDQSSIKDKTHFEKIAATALPLLVIKPPHSKGLLEVSKAQTMLSDIPATICAILNVDGTFDGRSVFAVDPKKQRERRFYYSHWTDQNFRKDFLDRLDEYIINGSVFDITSWQLGATYLSPKQSFNARKIDFGLGAARRFLRFGWSSDEKDSKEGLTFNWALGNSASIFLSLPKDEVVVLTANVKTLKFVKPQRVTIKVDGKEIGMWEIGSAWKWEKHSIVIEPDEHRPDVSTVEFLFSQYYEPDEKEQRPLAVLFESMTLAERGNSS